ncbi:NUMOD4 domain-containing protein [Chryseobacterium wanjuense]
MGTPQINKKNPPAIFDLSIKDLPNEYWKSLPGFEGKYVISNKGRIKRLSDWSAGYQFYGEEQIISLNVIKKDKSRYLYFKLHEGRYKPQNAFTAALLLLCRTI